MEEIQKNIEDERLKCFLLGFGMGLGFGIDLCTDIKTTNRLAPMGCILKEKGITCDGTNFSKDGDFENYDIRDIISDRSEDMDSQENSVNITDWPCDSPDIKDIISESPLMKSALKEESFENTEHLPVVESHIEEKIKLKIVECASCFSTFKSRSSLNRHQREKSDCGNFENHDITDINSDMLEDFDRRDKSEEITNCPFDSPDIKDIISKSPLMKCAPKHESFENTEHLPIGESHIEEKIRLKMVECAFCLLTFKSRSSLNRHHREKSDCRLRICKEPHDHEYTLRKFSSFEVSKAYSATLGKFQDNSETDLSKDKCSKSYCRYRKRLGCKASWSLKKNGLRDFVFTGCLKHVDSCLEMDHTRFKPGQRPKQRAEVRKRIRPKKFKCDKCDFKAISSSRVKVHIKSVHDKIKDNVCQECEYTCSSKGNLDIHIKSVHLKLKNYVCEECGSAFFNSFNLRLHKQSIHLNMRNYICEECGIAFNRKSSLHNHKKVVHLKIKKFVCQCGYATALRHNMKKHKAAVHKV